MGHSRTFWSWDGWFPEHHACLASVQCKIIQLIASSSTSTWALFTTQGPWPVSLFQGWSLLASMKPPTTASWNAISTSGRTSMLTTSCPGAPPCTPALPTACRRRSRPWRPAPWRSRYSSVTDPCMLLAMPALQPRGEGLFRGYILVTCTHGF